jgi:hypothetical protein
MEVKIVTPNGQLDEAVREYVGQRLRSGLLRFDPRIPRAKVSFSGLNGPYGSEQQCLLVLSLTPSGEISIERRGAGVRLALGRAVETATRELRRRFEATGESEGGVARGRREGD